MNENTVRQFVLECKQKSWPTLILFIFWKMKRTWKYFLRFSHLQTVASISKKKSFIEIIKSLAVCMYLVEKAVGKIDLLEY